jgi:hypothetical protein
MSSSTPADNLARVRSNVSSMIDQQATEAEIDAYLASEGTDPQDLQGTRMSPEDEASYIALAQDPRSTAGSLQGFAQAHGVAITDEDAAAFIRQRAAAGQVQPTVQYREAPVEQRVPSSPDKEDPNIALETTSATAGEFLDGLLPGACKTLAGVGGVLGNTLSAGLGRTDWHPGQAYAEEAAANDRDQARLEQDHSDLAAAAGWLGFGTSFALPAARLARGEGLAASVANNVATGAGYGVLSGALNDTGDGRLVNATNGGLVGGVLGGVAAPIARKVSGVLSTARRNIPGANDLATGLENLPRRLTGRPLVPASAAGHAQAERILNRELDGATIDQGFGTGSVPATPANVAAEISRRNAMSVPAMPADVSGKLRDTATWALLGNGTMASRARGILSARQAQAGLRVRQHLSDELGPAVDPIAEVEAIQRRASAASGPGYQAAYAQPVVVTPEMERIMATPAFRGALPQAVENIRNAKRSPEALGFRIDDQGNLEGINTLSTEGFDQVIRAMGDSRTAAMNTMGFHPRDTTNSVHIGARQQDLRAALSEQNPAYANTVANYADEMALREGIENGGRVTKLSGHEIEAQRRAMPPHAQEAWMAGARTALADAATDGSLRPGADIAQATRARLGLSGAGLTTSAGDAVKQRAIEDMAGSPGVLSRLDDRLEAEHQAWRTFADARSAGRQRGAMDGGAEALGLALDVGRKLTRGNIPGALATAVLRANPRGTAGFRRDVQDRMGQLVTATSPEDVAGFVGALSGRSATDAARQGALYRGAGNLTKVGTLQAAGLSTDPVPLDGGIPADLEAPYGTETPLQAPLYRRDF